VMAGGPESLAQPARVPGLIFTGEFRALRDHVVDGPPALCCGSRSAPHQATAR
jgi:hypothetical protein